MGLSQNRLAMALMSVVALIVAAVLHEMAHAGMAYVCGDRTAKEQGRLTLNPLAHIDPFGSIALPLVMILSGGPVFAYAKPVPYNPRNLQNEVRDEVLVALAGPVCNLLQAGVAAVVLRLMLAIPYWVDWQYVVAQLLYTYLYVNVCLMLFNLIPLPPLDGSAIISPLMRGRAREVYYHVQSYAMPILLIVLYLIPMVLHVDPLGNYLDMVGGGIIDFLLGA